LAETSGYKLTGLVVLVVGALFFLRDLGDATNFIGETRGSTIFLVLLGAALLAGDFKPSQIGKSAASMGSRFSSKPKKK